MCLSMMQAYKLVMNALKMRTTVSVEELLSAHAEQISEQAVKIMDVAHARCAKHQWMK